MRKTYIYIIGVSLLGLFQGLLKDSVPHGAIFLLIIVAYLIALRLLAEKIGKP